MKAHKCFCTHVWLTSIKSEWKIGSTEIQKQFQCSISVFVTLNAEESYRSEWCPFGMYMGKVLRLCVLPKRTVLLSSLYIGIPCVTLFEKGFCFRKEKRVWNSLSPILPMRDDCQLKHVSKAMNDKEPLFISKPANQDWKPISPICWAYISTSHNGMSVANMV